MQGGGARKGGEQQPVLLPDHFVPVALMDRTQCCAWRLRLLEVLVGYCVAATTHTPLAIAMCKEVYVRTSRCVVQMRAPPAPAPPARTRARRAR